ncbi:hypothetical protein chiPu_0001570 [Chiloscyllium punctatum]|uniref:LRRNT domain-containing protein n=1 Tax=Chiloscyllium punctatum TaxID=137246 RepID=A0A401RYE6_CHIPU|nr:hypothetical protein [Chiloscyllium punctatum]
MVFESFSSGHYSVTRKMTWIHFLGFLSITQLFGFANCIPKCDFSSEVLFCSGKLITEMPATIPSNTTRLTFLNTNISIIRAGVLQNYSASLTMLAFNDNNIHKIEIGALDDLTNLTQLEITGEEELICLTTTEKNRYGNFFETF